MGKTALFYTVRGQRGMDFTIEEPEPQGPLPGPADDSADAQIMELNIPGKAEVIPPPPGGQEPPRPDANPDHAVPHRILPDADDAIIIRAGNTTACFADGQSIPDAQADDESSDGTERASPGAEHGEA